MATYTITTLAELQAMSSHLTDNCVLVNDIDASATKYWNPGTGTNAGICYGFAPITSFGGTFDGGGYTIKNLYIRRIALEGATLYDRVGLFGYINYGAGIEIKDVTLENVDFTGETTGGLYASHYTNGSLCVISGITISGSVTSSSTAGGLGAGGDGETISDCHVSATVTGAGSVGGLLGYRYTGQVVGTIATSSFSGIINATIDGGDFVGGIIGRGTSALTGCMASGEINVSGVSASASHIGGLSGRCGAITTSHAYGNVNSLATGEVVVGGLAGYLADGATVSCSAHGNVENAATVNSKTGGFAGYVAGAGADITNCFSTGSVCLNGIGHGAATFGGFIGSLSNSTSDLTNCYSIGQVLTGVGVGGGFLGTKVGTNPPITSCYWDIETSGYTISAAGTGKTTVLMKTTTTFTGWDFATIWIMASLLRSPGSGSMMWFSETSQYDDFEEGVKDADSFSLTVPTGDSILWIEALESLLIGTTGEEWKIATSKLDTPITPTNFTVKQQSTRGSKNVQPIKVHDTILFVDSVGRKVRELTWSGDKYVAPDLTSLAEHITDTGILCFALQKHPEVILWCVLANNTLLSMTYDREQNVVAWAKHPTDGDVLSVCVIPNASLGEDEVWLSVGRMVNGADATHIERFEPRAIVGPRDNVLVDSGITVDHGASFLVERVTRSAQPIVFTAAYVLYNDESVYWEGESVTYETAHGFANNEFVRISGLTTPTELNDTVYLVSDATTYTFKIKDTAAVGYINTATYEDSSGIGSVEQVAKTFSGLEHLNGATVTVLGDGTLYGTAVVAVGSVTLTEYYNTVQIGRGFTAKVQPMRIVTGTQNGSSMGSITRVPELALSLMDSAGVQYGPSDSDLYDIDLTRPELENSSEITGLYSGDITVVHPGGFSVQSSIIVSSSSPLPFTLRAIIAKVEVTGR
jgi:hypothetical protein